MTEFTKAGSSDREDIIDFINYVFSKDDRPHDFKRLFPKCYGDDLDEMGAEHFIAREDGKIKGVVAGCPYFANVCGRRLKVSAIGSVSVHPYSRDRGYMKALMDMAIKDAIDAGYDYMILGGQRQRYGYYGFEYGGYKLCAEITQKCIKHAFCDTDASGIVIKELKPDMTDEIEYACSLYKKRPFCSERTADGFLNVLKTFDKKAYAVYYGEKQIGYFCGMIDECVLEDDEMLPRVIKAAYEKFMPDSISLSAFFYEPRRIEYLSAVCERSSICHSEMFHILNWKNVLEAMLNLKAEYCKLTDAEVNFSVDGKAFRITVKDNIPAVIELQKGQDTDFRLSHNAAQRMFFNIDGFLLNREKFGNLLPVPLCVDHGELF